TPADGLPALAEPAGRSQRGVGSLAGSLPPGFSDHPHLPGPVGSAHLDLSHRGQPGAESSAVVEAPPPLAPGLARRAHSGARRSARTEFEWIARYDARQEAARRTHSDGARRSAVRPAYGARPP